MFEFALLDAQSTAYTTGPNLNQDFATVGLLIGIDLMHFEMTGIHKKHL